MVGMSKQGKSTRCVVSIRKTVYHRLRQLSLFQSCRIGLTRPVPITYIIERLVAREFKALAKRGLTVPDLTVKTELKCE